MSSNCPNIRNRFGTLNNVKKHAQIIGFSLCKVNMSYKTDLVMFSMPCVLVFTIYMPCRMLQRFNVSVVCCSNITVIGLQPAS
jgi:hypothetical protein